MKRKVTSILLGLIFLIGILGIEKTAKAEPDHWYKVETTLVYIEGILYVKSECLEINGTSCNMPGSIHLIEIPQIWLF